MYVRGSVSLGHPCVRGSADRHDGVVRGRYHTDRESWRPHPYGLKIVVVGNASREAESWNYSVWSGKSYVSNPGEDAETHIIRDWLTTG